MYTDRYRLLIYSINLPISIQLRYFKFTLGTMENVHHKLSFHLTLNMETTF